MKEQKSLSVNAAQLRVFERLFLTWLFDNDLYWDFVSCLSSAGCNMSVQSYVARFFNNPSRPSRFIVMCAFNWLDTPQGYFFWRQVSDDWNLYLDRFIESLN